MREIKFRAWDKKGKEMFRVAMISFLDKGEMILTGRGGSTDNKTTILMQFTGLHDKNNKEIWEGDIVKTINNEIGKVVFSIGGFWSEYLWPHNWDPMYPAELINEKCEVIGNIYENPELLKERP